MLLPPVNLGKPPKAEEVKPPEIDMGLLANKAKKSEANEKTPKKRIVYKILENAPKSI